MGKDKAELDMQPDPDRDARALEIGRINIEIRRRTADRERLKLILSGLGEWIKSMEDPDRDPDVPKDAKSFVELSELAAFGRKVRTGTKEIGGLEEKLKSLLERA